MFGKLFDISLTNATINQVVVVSSGVALVVHLFVCWLFVYRLGLGVVGTMATVNVSWCLNAFILFTYATSGANELGAGNGRRARFAMIISVIESLITGLIFSVLVVFLHDQIGWIFSSSETVIKAVTDLSLSF